MHKHKMFLLWLVMAVFAIGGCSQNPQQQKHVTVAIVNASHNFDPFIVEFKKGMELAGYHPGKNITYLYNGPIPREQIIPRLSFLRQQKIDLLYTITTPITQKAHQIFANSKTPILFAPIFSPVEAGLINAQSRCGKNITGIMVRGSTAKTLGYLMECMPKLKTIFAPFPNDELPAQLNIADLKQEANKYGLTIITAEVKDKTSLYHALQTIPSKVDAVWMPHSHLIIANNAAIIAAATQRNLPIASTSSQYRKGALLSYAPSTVALGRQASRMATKILHGIPASEIPVEKAEYFLGINLKTARTLGIEVRNDILRQAAFIER